VALRGEVYFPDATVPPNQSIPHRCIVLSPDHLTGGLGNKLLFVNVAIIRSATDRLGNPVPVVQGHSIRITPQDLPRLRHDSYVETHQIFAIPLSAFSAKNLIGKLPAQLMNRVLDGVRLLFS
jgi:hypothetical protein